MPQRSHCPILSQRTAPPPASKSSPSPKQLLINSSNYLNNERWVSWPFPCSFPFVPPVKKILAVEPWEDGNWRVTGEKLCGAWVSGLELAAGRAVVGEGSTTSSGQACGPASKVRKYRQYGGCKRPGCRSFTVLRLCRSLDLGTLCLSTTRWGENG